MADGQEPGDRNLSDRDIGDGNSGNRDSGQFITLFARNQHTVHAYVRAVVPNRTDADDIMQEVSLTLWNKWHTFEEGTDFLRWACSVAFIEILRYRRKSAKSRFWFSEPLLELMTADFCEHADIYALRLDALSSCVEKLDREDRWFIEVHYRQGGSVRNLAEESGKPLSTVYKILLRIRESLRRCVDRTIASQSHASLPN